MVTAYVVDRRDRIVEVSGEWDRFAVENGGEGACAQHVLGGRLVDSIDGDPVRMFMVAILMRVRASGQPETVPYRCDSEAVKRCYTMTVTPLADGAVRVEHRLDREEPSLRTVRVQPARRGGPFRFRCSICCRIREDAGWTDPFDGPTDRDLRVIHTVCEGCKRTPRANFRARRRAVEA